MKYAYLLLAYLALGIAFLGMLLPGLPATEFLLLAAWAAGKSSPRLHAWMMNHKLIGPPLRDWHQGQVIRKPTKLIASTAMLVTAVLLTATVNHIPSLIIMLSGMSLGAVWIWTRPSDLTTNNNQL